MEVEMEMGYVDELRHLLTIAKNQQTIQHLQKGIDAETKKQSVQNGVADTHEMKLTSGGSKPLKPTPMLVKISNYGWDQSDKFVKLYISDLPGLSEVTNDNVKPTFTEKTMQVEILNLKGKKYSLLINDLLKPILPDQSSAKIKSGMVIISLKKKSSSSWDCLTGREKKLKESKEMKPSAPDKGEDPGAGIMQMMQKMYDEGDDDMKRTIKKAWHESQEKKMKGDGGGLMNGGEDGGF